MPKHLPVCTTVSCCLCLPLLLLLTGCGEDHRPQELRDAIALGDDDTAYAILRHSPELAGSADVCGDTPLHFAAARGNTVLLDALLSAGADPRAQDLLGFTPLHHAARAGSSPAVERLLAAKADPAALSKDRWTPLHYALLANPQTSPAAAAADSASRLEILRLLVAAKVPLNAPAGRWLVTPLHVAAVRGQAALVKALLDVGADPALKDGDGKTPLDEARHAKAEAVVKVLEAPRGQP